MLTAYEADCADCDRNVFRWVRSTNTSGYYIRCADCGTPRWATVKRDAARDHAQEAEQ